MAHRREAADDALTGAGKCGKRGCEILALIVALPGQRIAIDVGEDRPLLAQHPLQPYCVAVAVDVAQMADMLDGRESARLRARAPSLCHDLLGKRADLPRDPRQGRNLLAKLFSVLAHDILDTTPSALPRPRTRRRAAPP